MVSDTVATLLRKHENELRLRLCDVTGEGVEPEDGSDAALFLEALQAAPLESYLPRFESSARVLAEQGGRLEARLAAVQAWQRALSGALSDLLRQDPAAMAQAQVHLASVTAEILIVVTTAFRLAEEHALLEEAERARRGVTRMQALQRINAAANSTLDLDQTLTTAAEAVAEEMGADLCAIFLFDDVTRDLQLRATNGPYPRGGRHYALALGQGYSGWVAEYGHPLVVADASGDGRFSAEATAYAETYRGLLAAPIIFFNGVKLQGVIAVQTRAARTFTDEERDFLEIVAGQLAMNIENGRLYEQTDEELRRKVHELSTLHHVSALVTSTLVLDNVLRIIVSQAVLLSGADRSVLFELDPSTQRLRVAASHGFATQQLAHAGVPVGRCCVGRVVRGGEPSMEVDCMRHDEGCFLRDLPEAIGDQHAVLCAPLSTVHGPLGALCVFSSQRHMLNAHQLQLVVTFANVAAIAMENARLFTQTREGLRTKEVLLREMHHRVKNNLQQVASILNMQRRRAKLPEVEQILLESVDRIQGIAATHDLLSNTELGVAPVDDIARKIVGIVGGNLVPPHLRVHFHIDPVPFHVPSEQATTLAIVLNELIANAIEHGFEGRARGEIWITGAEEDGHVDLRVADDGCGLPDGFSVPSAEGLGLQLVRSLVEGDLRGSFEIFETRADPSARGARARSGEDAGDGGGAAEGSAEGSAGASRTGRRWVVSEIRFPVALREEEAYAQRLTGETV
jgi:two-component system, sensor histidine kinase PdtaS